MCYVFFPWSKKKVFYSSLLPFILPGLGVRCKVLRADAWTANSQLPGYCIPITPAPARADVELMQGLVSFASAAPPAQALQATALPV